MVCRIFKPPFSLVAWVADVTRIDNITRIKLDAVNQSFAMLAQGFLPYQILEFMTGPYNSRQTLHPAVANARLAAISQRHLATSSQHSQQVSQTPDQASSFVLPSIERPTEPQPRGRTVSSTWRKIEPKLTGQSVLNHADAPGTYTQMQQRFEQGDLARLVEQKHPLYMMSREGALSAVHNTPFSYEAMSRMQTMTPSMEDATLQASRRISQPTAHLLLQQATSRMGSVTSNSQGAALASHTNQAMSQPQRATPSMQDTASQVQDYMMAMSQPQSATPNMQDTTSQVQDYTMTTETPADGHNTEDVTGNTKTNKKKPKLNTKTEKKAAPGGTVTPRCPKCIKGHKRCTHRAQESPASNVPLGSSPFDVPSTPSNYVPSAGVEEDYTPAPIAMPDHLLTLPVTSVEVPVQAAAKKAAPKRKR
jgi:hypothetical protein